MHQIKASLFPNKCIDIDPTNNKVQLYDCSNTRNQSFYYNSNTKQIGMFYNLKKCLELETDSKSPGTKVIVSDCNIANNMQKFTLDKQNIKINDNCLSINSGLYRNNDQIEIQPCGTAHNNNFKFDLPPYSFKIKALLRPNKCIDIDPTTNKVQMYDCSDTRNQYFNYDSNTKQIGNNQLNKCLQLEENSKREGVQAIVKDCDNTNNMQKFIFNKDDKTIKVESLDNMCLNMYGGQYENNEGIVSWPCGMDGNIAHNNKFEFDLQTKKETPTPTATPTDTPTATQTPR